MSGIRSIMEDIATAEAESSAGVWLNLSPGNPALIAEVVDTWRELAAEAVVDSFVEASGRYGPSRGMHSLVAGIVGYFRERYDWPIGPENVVVGPGSQMLCFMATTSFTGPAANGMFRPLVLPRLPDYAGYQGLNLEPNGIIGIEPVVTNQDDRYFRYGVDVAALERQSDMGMLLISNPANPTGSTLSDEELDALVAVAERHDVPLVVDNAYGEPFPRVVGTNAAPRWHPNVLNCFTFSKAGIPGERIAFAIGTADLIRPLVSFTANAALHAPQLMQSAVERALRSKRIDALSDQVIKPYYQAKRRAAEELLFDNLPESINWRIHASDGGMFCWLWVDHEWFDDIALYEALKARKVLVVPGRHFFVRPLSAPFLPGHSTRCVRLSLSGDDWVIADGIVRLSETLLELRDERQSA